MAQCVYCLKTDQETTFNSKEHVIPKSLGRFNSASPTIKRDVVCDNCNSSFSLLESEFIEDTYEGIHSQRLGLGNRGSLIFRDKNFKIDNTKGFGDGFFKEMFPFLELKDGKYVPVLKNQIKLKRKSGGYRVFSPDALRRLSPGTSQFRKIALELRNLDQKNMSIFAETHDEVLSIIELLGEFGVRYKEKESHYREFKPGDQVVVEEEYTCTINKNIARVLAKIAFNYFAYCAIQDNAKHVLYYDNFAPIRNFIHSGVGDGVKQFIPSITEPPFLLTPEGKPSVITGHLISFLSEDGKIFVRLNLFGLQPIYKIYLGDTPRDLNGSRFGCEHAFIPFNQVIFNLSQTSPEALTDEQVRLSFGLFRRN
jgi:hypothetical protein